MDQRDDRDELEHVTRQIKQRWWLTAAIFIFLYFPGRTLYREMSEGKNLADSPAEVTAFLVLAFLGIAVAAYLLYANSKSMKEKRQLESEQGDSL